MYSKGGKVRQNKMDSFLQYPSSSLSFFPSSCLLAISSSQDYCMPCFSCVSTKVPILGMFFHRKIYVLVFDFLLFPLSPFPSFYFLFFLPSSFSSINSHCFRNIYFSRKKCILCNRPAKIMSCFKK